MEEIKFDAVYDGKDKILGRLASTVAKQLLQGKNVAVVNAEDCIISGNKADILAKYKKRVDLIEKANPEHSAYWSRRPDLLVKRVIRGMLPYHKKATGKAAYKKLRVYVGMPEELKNTKLIAIETKNPKELYVKYVRISEVSKLLGYNK